MLESAFNFAYKLQSREMTFYDVDNATGYTVNIAPSNYFRNLSGPEEITIKGREFVISSKELERVSAPIPKRNFRILDPTGSGNNTITEVRELTALGKVIGFRLRTS